MRTVEDIEYRSNGHSGVYPVQEERELWRILSTGGAATVGDIEYRRNLVSG
jgi:hypothetical protein